MLRPIKSGDELIRGSVEPLCCTPCFFYLRHTCSAVISHVPSKPGLCSRADGSNSISFPPEKKLCSKVNHNYFPHFFIPAFIVIYKIQPSFFASALH